MSSSPHSPTSTAASRSDLSALASALYTTPTPIADSLSLLLSAESRFEERDRVVEVFRSQLRLLATFVLAARVQFGPGPGAPSPQVADLLRQLRGRGLTDGQWLAIVRELTRSWVDSPDAYPIPSLVKLVHARKSELVKLWDELLVMRKSETVAHGATGTRAALEQILEKRIPQLARTFVLLAPVWESLRLVVPRRSDKPHEAEPLSTLRSASLFLGPTPRGGKFRRIKLALEASVPNDQLLLVDEEGSPKLALSPLAILSAESTHEETIFLLDGPAKRGALYVGFPSMLEHRDPDGFAGLTELLPEEDDAPKSERSSANSPERPYRGLASFGPEEATLFFGRETEAQALANRIRGCGFVTVTGASGCGKTSLLRAGTLPLLSDVMVAFVRPGAHPTASFVSRVSEALEVPRTELEALTHKPSELRALVEEVVRKSSQWFVLVVDQAEELLTVTTDTGEREAFGCILRALGQTESKTRVVLSIREDFFARLATIPSLVGVFSREVEVVTTPNRDALIRILLGPAKAFGYTFEDEELVLALIDSVAEANAALALLSFAADRLWEARDRKWKRLTHAAFDAQGGVKGALAAHADATVGALSSSEAAACRSMFLALTTPDKTRAIVLRSELLGGAREPAEAERVLERLVAARLLTTTEDAAGASTIEIVHEALIVHWAKLAAWLSEDVEGQRLRHAIRQAAREWETRARPRGLLWRGELLVEMRVFLKRLRDPLLPAEQDFADACAALERGEKRTRRLLVGGAFLSLAIFAVFMIFQWQKAKRATSVAEERRVETEERRVEAEHERKNAEIRALVAEARGQEAKGLVDEAHALYRAAVAVESELGGEETSRELLDLARLETDGAGVIDLPSLKRPAHQLAPSPVHGLIFVAGSEDDLVVVDVVLQAIRHRLPHPGLISGLDISKDERFLATLSHDERQKTALLRVYELPSMKLTFAQPDLPATLEGLSFATDGDSVFLGMVGGVTEFSVPSGEARVRGGDHDARFAAGGRGLVAIADASRTVVVDGSDRILFARAHALSESPRIALSEDESILALSGTGRIETFDVKTGAQLPHTIALPGKERVSRLTFAGESLIATTLEGTVFFRNLTNNLQERVVTGRGSPRLAATAERVALVRGSSAELYHLATGTRMSSRLGHEGDINQVALYGDRLVTTGWDKRLRIEAAERVRPVEPLSSVPAAGHLTATSRDGGRIAYASSSFKDFGLAWHDVSDSPRTPRRFEGRALALRGDRSLSRLVVLGESELKCFDSPTVSAPRPIGFPAKTRRAAFDVTADLGTVVVGDELGGLFVTSFAGEGRYVPDVHTDQVSQVVLSQDGALAATAGLDRVVHVTRLTDGAPLFSWEAEWLNTQLGFSPDGKVFALASQGSLGVFDARTFEVLAFDPIEDLSPTGLAFSPDSASLALSSAGDVSVRLYNLRTMTSHSLESDEGALSVTFPSDGRRVVATGTSGGIMSWQDGRSPARRARVNQGDNTVVPIDDSDDVWVLGGVPTRVGFPLASRAALLEASGVHTNLRVCRESMRIVRGDAASAWADPSTCLDAP
jgi:WD40 repeat protein